MPKKSSPGQPQLGQPRYTESGDLYGPVKMGHGVEHGAILKGLFRVESLTRLEKHRKKLVALEVKKKEHEKKLEESKKAAEELKSSNLGLYSCKWNYRLDGDDSTNGNRRNTIIGHRMTVTNFTQPPLNKSSSAPSTSVFQQSVAEEPIPLRPADKMLAKARIAAQHFGDAPFVLLGRGAMVPSNPENYEKYINDPKTYGLCPRGLNFGAGGAECGWTQQPGRGAVPTKERREFEESLLAAAAAEEKAAEKKKKEEAEKKK